MVSEPGRRKLVVVLVVLGFLLVAAEVGGKFAHGRQTKQKSANSTEGEEVAQLSAVYKQLNLVLEELLDVAEAAERTVEVK